MQWLTGRIQRPSTAAIYRVYCPQPPPRPPRSHPRLFSSTSARHARPSDENHYDILGVNKSASKREIKEKFYELSRKYHPDAPTSSSESLESRTKYFQSLSQSYSVLSDDNLRRAYDSSLSGGGGYSQRPGYTSSGPAQSGFGGGSSAAWSSTQNANEARRSSANYAWAHPSRRARTGPSPSATASQRPDPFGRQAGGMNESHFESFQAREARARERAYERHGGGGSHGPGTAGFGAKAAEESRLINDSAVLRTGQVFVLFLGLLAVSQFFRRGKHPEDHKQARR